MRSFASSRAFCIDPISLLPGPKRGYVLTLQLADQRPVLQAAIDVPGVQEEAVWAWLKTKYPAFDHRIPREGGVEDFLASEITRHLKERLGGQRVVARMEQSLTGHTIMVFQPELLPQIWDCKIWSARSNRSYARRVGGHSVSP